MKVLLVCSQGGHFTESLQIVDAFEGHTLVVATYFSSREAEVKRLGAAYFTRNIGLNPLRMTGAFCWALYIMLRERPSVIVSLGAEIAIPFFIWGRLLRIRTIFIESWCRVENLSRTGRVLYPFADVFFVQWPQLLANCGRKAQFQGAVI